MNRNILNTQHIVELLMFDCRHISMFVSSFVDVESHQSASLIVFPILCLDRVGSIYLNFLIFSFSVQEAAWLLAPPPPALPLKDIINLSIWSRHFFISSLFPVERERVSEFHRSTGFDKLQRVIRNLDLKRSVSIIDNKTNVNIYQR